MKLLTVQENLPLSEAIGQDSITYLDSDQEIFPAPDFLGAKCNTKVGDRTTTILQTKCPNSGPDNDSSLHFPAGALRQYQNDTERQDR